MNVIMLAMSGDDYLRSLTQTSIESLQRSAKAGGPALGEIKIAVVESAPSAAPYTGVDLTVARAPGPFNYNAALNQGVKAAEKAFGASKWWCFSNNDVIFAEDWLAEISEAVAENPDIGAVSPNQRQKKPGVDVGYTLQKNFDGCCFMLKDSVLRRLLPFDERFEFYFQDDDILERLKAMNVKCARVLSSKVFHIGSQTKKPTGELLGRCFRAFVSKYSSEIYMRNEMAKREFWRQCGEI